MTRMPTYRPEIPTLHLLLDLRPHHAEGYAGPGAQKSGGLVSPLQSPDVVLAVGPLPRDVLPFLKSLDRSVPLLALLEKIRQPRSEGGEDAPRGSALH